MESKYNLIEEFDALPQEWNAWLIENLERNCNPLDLLEILWGEGLISTSPLMLMTAAKSSTEFHDWLKKISQQTQQRNTRNELQNGAKKWLAKAILDEKSQSEIYSTLTSQGFNQSDIANEILNLKQHPYFQIAQEEHHLVKKRDWLLNTLDRFARLNPEYKQIKRIATPTFESFIQNYYSRNLPVILTNAIDHWSALRKWSPQYFKRIVGNKQIEVQFNREQDPLFERNSIQHKTQMQMSDLVDLIEATEHSNNFYMTTNNAQANKSSLSKLFQDIGDFHNFTDHKQYTERSFIWFGPQGAFTPLHHDLTNNFLVQIYGRKKITLFPALQTPHLYNDVAVFSKIANPNQVEANLSFPALKQTSRIECILNEGESLFIPLGWWHCVESLDIAISVSFTHFHIDNGGAETFPTSLL